MPPYRNTHQNPSGSSGANPGMSADVFDEMARTMRDAFDGAFEGVGVHPFTSIPPAASGPSANKNTTSSATGPNVGNLGNGAGFSFVFAATPGEHGLPREGPAPPQFKDHEGRPYGFNWTQSNSQGDAHPGSKPYSPSEDTGPRHHHHHHHHGGGPSSCRGRFNPYGRGGPPPHFPHHHHHFSPPPPPFSHGGFPFGFGVPRPFPFGPGGPFDRDGPFGFRGPWNRRPPPPPFASNMEERFEKMRQQEAESWKKLFERLGEMRDRMNNAQNAHYHDFGSDFRFGRGYEDYQHNRRQDGNTSSPGGQGAPPRSRAPPKPEHKARARPIDIAKAWETYSVQWKKLTATDAPSTIKLSEIPWPVIVDTSKMKALSDMTSKVTTITVGEFILSPKHSPDVSNKKRIHQALRLYHPDRFETVVVAKVEEKDKKSVRELGEVVAKCLNKLLEKEN